MFICSKEEVVESLKRRNPYAGLANAIIAGKDISSFGFETTDMYTGQNATDLQALLEKQKTVTKKDQKKSVQFKLNKVQEKKLKDFVPLSDLEQQQLSDKQARNKQLLNHAFDMLPAAPSEKDDRRALFRKLDLNQSNSLSLTELKEGFKNILLPRDHPPTLEVDSILLYALNCTDERYKNKEHGIVAKRQFRWMLRYAQKYLQMWALFTEVDLADKGYFVKEDLVKAKPLLEEHEIDLLDPTQAFIDMDLN